MTDDLLTSATEALREVPVDSDGAATRLRVRRSLEASRRGRRRLAGFLTGSGILLAGTMSWAFATGRAEAVWHAIVDPAPVYDDRVESQRSAIPPARAPLHQIARAVPEQQVVPEAPKSDSSVPVPPVEQMTKPVPAPSAPAPAPRAPALAPAAAPRGEVSVRPREPAAAPREPVAAPRGAAAPPIEALYRRAHELHFHGADHAAAIAAWDAYLAAEPTGRFVAEARYNRALLLIRVGRYAEARAALAPYARGEIAGGYRRAEAAQLIERLPGGGQ